MAATTRSVNCEILEEITAPGPRTIHRYTVNGHYREDSYGIVHEFQDIYNLPIQSDDVFLATYVRSGTTATQRLILALKSERTYSGIMDMWGSSFPFLEMRNKFHNGLLSAKELASPRFIKTHLQQQIIPHQVLSIKPKVVFVYRPVKDVLVSSYNFYLNNPSLNGFLKGNGEFYYFFDKFIAGEITCGSYFDYHKDWFGYVFSEEGQSHCLVKPYAEFLSNKRQYATDIATFIGIEPTEEALSRAERLTEFDKMKIEVAFPEAYNIKDFFWKGAAGNWQGFLTEKQEEILDEKVKSVLGKHAALVL